MHFIDKNIRQYQTVRNDIAFLYACCLSQDASAAVPHAFLERRETKVELDCLDDVLAQISVG